MKLCLLLLVIVLLLPCCKPKNDTTITGGGKGGSSTIRIAPQYYGDPVDTCTVYIKYGSLDAPASGVYDDSAVCTVVNDTSAAVFNGLTTGLYYFFARGYHSTGGHPPNVKGGTNCTVQNSGSYLFFLPTSSYLP